uniref:Uncharacterized protein n=1 Tax=Parascaris equorum TaxID=6256 RepID=A0A914S0H6_PAREQ
MPSTIRSYSSSANGIVSSSLLNGSSELASVMVPSIVRRLFVNGSPNSGSLSQSCSLCNIQNITS